MGGVRDANPYEITAPKKEQVSDDDIATPVRRSVAALTILFFLVLSWLAAGNEYEWTGVKDRLSSPVTTYIYKPMALWMAQYVEGVLTANQVTGLHVVCAVISAFLFARTSWRGQFLGILVFSLRNVLDDLDGILAREQIMRGAISNSRAESIADPLGTFCMLVGLSISLYKSRPHLDAGTRVLAGRSGLLTPGMWRRLLALDSTRTGKTIACFIICTGLQIAIRAHVWLMTIDFYEQNHAKPSIMVSFLWKLSCGDTMLQFIIVAVALRMTWKFLLLIVTYGSAGFSVVLAWTYMDMRVKRELLTSTGVA